MQAVALAAAKGLSKPTRPHAVLDDFLSRAQVVGADTTSLRLEVEALKTEARGDWIVGRTGGGRTADAQGQTTSGQYRDDEIFWLRDERVARYGLQALPALWRAVDHLVAEVNAALPNKLRWELGGRTTPMVACYHPGSAGYSYHVDNPDRDGRILTAIFYLNKGWRPADGGCVRLHPSLVAPAPATSDSVTVSHSASLTLEKTVATTVLSAMTVDQVSVSVAEGLRGKLDAGVLLHLVQKIKVEEIDGEVLDSLTEADMEQVLGLCTFGQRRKFSKLIARLSNGGRVAGASEGETGQRASDKETGYASAAARHVGATVGADAAVDVRPIDGRLLLFWSDRRTPHEVLPLFPNATIKDGRVAVTCWYYDAAERAKALANSGATAEMLLSSSSSPTFSSLMAIETQEKGIGQSESSAPMAVAEAAAAKNKKKNRKKKDRKKQKKQAADVETAAVSDGSTSYRSIASPAATGRSSDKLVEEAADVTSPRATDIVITEELLCERIAALLAREGKESFMAMKGPDFFEKLQADPELGGPGVNLLSHRRQIAIQVLKAKQALRPPATPPSSASSSSSDSEPDDESDDSSTEHLITMMHGVPIEQVPYGPSPENQKNTHSSSSGENLGSHRSSTEDAEYLQSLVRKQAWAVSSEPSTKPAPVQNEDHRPPVRRNKRDTQGEGEQIQSQTVVSWRQQEEEEEEEEEQEEEEETATATGGMAERYSAAQAAMVDAERVLITKNKNMAVHERALKAKEVRVAKLKDSLQLNAIVDKLRLSLTEETIASMAEFVYGHPESMNDPSVALAELGVDPAVQAAAMVLLKEHMDKPASVERHVATMVAQTRQTATSLASTEKEKNQQREDLDADDVDQQPQQPQPQLQRQPQRQHKVLQQTQAGSEEDDTGGLLELD